MHTYPWHVGDFGKDTNHLGEDETPVTVKAGLIRELAYRRLLDLYYSQEGPIPNKTQWVSTRIRMASQPALVGSVLREFFTLQDGFWHQKRADAEIAKYQKRADSNRKNGKNGGRKPSGNPVGTQSVTTRTRTRTINTPLTPQGEAAFEEFWSAYPRKVGRPIARGQFAKALTRTTADVIQAGLARHIGCAQWADQTKIPHPSTWLNRDGWADEVAKAPGEKGAGNWWESHGGLLERARALGVPEPAAGDPVGFMRFKARLWVLAGDGPWWDNNDSAYSMAVKMRNGGE